MASVTVIGGGLAGSEAAWQAAQRDVDVVLYEMRPEVMTPAHRTGQLAELVCSNSLGSNLIDRASGLLKEELRRLDSLVVACADATALPAGGALAVDREAFSQLVGERISSHPRIEMRRGEVKELPNERPLVVATGPLTSEALSRALARLLGEDYLYFYDAMAPIVAGESVDLAVAFRASRYGRGQDYMNCPMGREEYYRFVEGLATAETMPPRDFEDLRFFEGCLPIEVLAKRGKDALAYGPMRPVGLLDPKNGKRPHAVVQLRQDNLAGTLYNMVGFQTNLKWEEQDRLFRLIPGLEKAVFVRYGQMHRNTFVNGPAVLEPTMMCRRAEGVFLGGQLAGTEGYAAAIAGGLIAGMNAAAFATGGRLVLFPPVTMLGALSCYVSTGDESRFQPMKANFGLLPPLAIRGKGSRYRGYSTRALAALEEYSRSQQLSHTPTTKPTQTAKNVRLREARGRFQE